MLSRRSYFRDAVTGPRVGVVAVLEGRLRFPTDAAEPWRPEPAENIAGSGQGLRKVGGLQFPSQNLVFVLDFLGELYLLLFWPWTLERDYAFRIRWEGSRSQLNQADHLFGTQPGYKVFRLKIPLFRRPGECPFPALFGPVLPFQRDGG